MAKLTGTDAPVAAWCTAPGWMRWAHFSRDGLAHAFPTEDSPRERWPQAGCTHTVPPAALGPATVAGPGCRRCALAIAAAGTVRRHRRDRPGVCARLLDWLRRHRHDQQSPPLARIADITLAPTTAEPAERGTWARGIAGPGTAASCVRVPQRPGHDNPGAAR